MRGLAQPASDDTRHWLRCAASPAHAARDSRQVEPGDGFIAWPGAATDGRKLMSPPRSQPARPPAWSRRRRRGLRLRPTTRIARVPA